jgi:thiamine phosphate synthase YjbQ (UPF0047 family)
MLAYRAILEVKPRYMATVRELLKKVFSETCCGATKIRVWTPGINADAHMKRQIIGREVVVAVTNGRLDGFALLTKIFGPWEQILGTAVPALALEFDGRRRKCVLVKIVGE